MSIKFFDRKRLLILLIILAHLTFSYYYFPWFLSAFAGSVSIIILSYFTWKSNYRFWIGLQLKTKDYQIALVLFFVFLCGSFLLIKSIAATQNIKVIGGGYKNFTHTLFYTLNEEIVIGALLLKGIHYYRKSLPKWLISVGTAFVFAGIHFIFFRWIFNNQGNIGLTALTSLFFTGIIRNNLILKTGHIGYSWALHFGWIYIMLGSSHYNIAGKFFLNDFERFVIYLGDYRTLIVCLILAALSFFYLNKSTSS